MKRDHGFRWSWLGQAIRGRWMVPGLLAVHAGLLIFGAVIHSPSLDEPVHLHAGLHMVREGYFGYNLGNPPLVDVLAALPVLALFPEFDLVAVRYLDLRAVPRHGEWLMWVFTLSRLSLLPFSLLGGYCVFRWSGRLYGRAAAQLALVLWCFSPCLLAFGQQVTGDMAATSTGVFAAYNFWKWLQNPGWSAAIGAGLAGGLALLAKMIWVILFGLWPLMWLGWLMFHPTRFSLREVGSQAGQLAILLFCALYVLNIGYGFEATMLPLSRYGTTVQPILGFALPAAIESLPLPLPYHYVRGLTDIRDVLAVSERSYLAGQWKNEGWWYYYLYGMAVKLPLGVLVLLGSAVGLSLIRRRGWKRELTMLVPGLVLLAVVSFTTQSMSTQYRYILPVYPFLLIYASKPGRLLIRRVRRKRLQAVAVRNWAPSVAVASMAAGAVVSSLLAYPHSMAYFNELAGGRSRGHQHFLGSSLHSGEDLWLLKRWKDRHCPNQPLWLGYRTVVHPEWLGLDFRPLPSGAEPRLAHADPVEPPFGPQPGWYAIDVSLLCGKHTDSWHDEHFTSRLDPRQFAYLHQLQPVDRISYSILIYHLSATEAKRLRQEYGYPTEVTQR